MYDAIEYRGFSQEVVEELAEYSGVPVFNGLTDEWHPTQMLMRSVDNERNLPENHGKRLALLILAMPDSTPAIPLLMIGAKMGMDVRIGAPKEYWPNEELLALCQSFAEASGARILLTRRSSRSCPRC